jgi:N-methylhydantoinase B/oxoprolinase/acetone carboxylase alpha subunit
MFAALRRTAMSAINRPAEVAEARYGVTVDYPSFHDEGGGAGFHWGGQGCGLTTAPSPTTLRQAQDTAPG